MADIADVRAALVSVLTTVFYPNGDTTQPSLVAGNVPVRIQQGWPIPRNLDADLAAGIANVSVYAQPGLERNTTRYPRDWHTLTTTTPAIAGTVAGQTITLSGSPTLSHYATVIIANKAFSYACVAGDTLASVAAALAALIDPVFPCYSNGAQIVVVGPPIAALRFGAPDTVIQEVGRSNQRFIIPVFANSDEQRVAVARLIRPALDNIDFLELADGSGGRLVYENSSDIDKDQRSNAYRRDNFYWVEYPVTNAQTAYPITAPIVTIDVLDMTGATAGSISVSS